MRVHYIVDVCFNRPRVSCLLRCVVFGALFDRGICVCCVLWLYVLFPVPASCLAAWLLV